MVQFVNKFIILILSVSVLFFISEQVYAQEPKLATFQETAQLLIDKQILNNFTASITLQSTSNQELKIPSELEQKLRENHRIVSVILTNEDQCVLGVQEEGCLMINVSRDDSEKGIIEIQEGAKKIGDLYIDDLNSFFDVEAEFHSSFVHHGDEVNELLETSGVVSGRGTVSAVYTMPKEDTASMYEKISAILLPKIIRDSGGFYDIARNLSIDENSRMTFSIIPQGETILFQLRLAVTGPYQESANNQINPLEFFNSNELKKSEYFSSGFYPLNSIFHVVILSAEPISVVKTNANLVPTQMVEGEKIPSDITIAGWLFSPQSGEKIDGKYLFGTESAVNENELIFVVGQEGQEIPNPPQEIEFGEEMIIIIIIVASSGAVVFFLKGYKK